MLDKHDPRAFDQFVSFNDDGTVAATHMILNTASAPDDGAVFVKVPETLGMDLSTLAVNPVLLTAVKQARVTLASAAADHAKAFTQHAAAERVVSDAVTAAALAHAKTG